MSTLDMQLTQNEWESLSSATQERFREHSLWIAKQLQERDERIYELSRQVNSLAELRRKIDDLESRVASLLADAQKAFDNARKLQVVNDRLEEEAIMLRSMLKNQKEKAAK